MAVDWMWYMRLKMVPGFCLGNVMAELTLLRMIDIRGVDGGRAGGGFAEMLFSGRCS